MQSKIKQSIAVKRQIPEHIRNTYPVFVEFVQLYYDFLQQTQAQELESIRDIDTTLDIFIDSFKDELAKSFPVEMTGDKRLILKHLREFYLSRGSEASYKFLFRALFNKEAELFYPSTQILRASDGKWNQDVSIFIKANTDNLDVAGIAGQYIVITNNRGKRITTIVKNVIPYSSEISEVFIEREFASEISSDNTIFCSNNSFSGVILPCPSKVSVYKAGKGFKAGTIYALKTQIGRGCVIKVTGVNSEGGITAIQVMRFGLDYKTKFWSYLSSKDLQPIEYIHPLQLNHPYNSAEPAYNERSGGFIDYGWASKQTYFYYDEQIPVGTPDRASDRFFANPDYVGEIAQQFYAEDTTNPIDEDLAIIQIDIGAVAKYPGYYMKADGFVSDQSYIQDGEYYQAFSYVIKVEEELRKYADIVKALIHPAGMKMYSEYNIFNSIEISAVTPRLFNILQLPLADHTPSTTTVDDRGYGYDKYTTSIVDGQIVVEPAEDAIKVYAKQGKPSFFVKKLIEDIAIGYDQQSKSVAKIVEDAIDSMSDSQQKATYKAVSDVISEYLETQVRDIVKNKNDISIAEDSNSKLFETIKTDIQLIVDSYSNLLEKPLSDAITDIIDDNVRSLIKGIIDYISTGDSSFSDTSKAISDNLSLDELLARLHEKTFNEDIIVQDVLQLLRAIIFEDFVSQPLDSILNELIKTVYDTQPLTDRSASAMTKASVETINIVTDGRIRLAPYDEENYFAVYEDYQLAASIT